MEIGTIISLTVYFIVMLGIGFYAYKKSTSDISGYMLGGRNLSPSVTALSAGASDMSGWMLMGLPGAMSVSGASNSWPSSPCGGISFVLKERSRLLYFF